MLSYMLEGYIPGVTHSLGFEPVTPSSDQLLSVKGGRKTYHKNTGLYLHLAAMELRCTDDPEETSELEQFMTDTRSWMKGLSRIGVPDFDVKTPEELQERVANFKRQGPLVRTVTEYRHLPAVEPLGILRIRQDVAVLIPSALLTLLALTHTNVWADSWERTKSDLQGKCVALLPEVKTNHTNEYNQWLV